MAFEIHAPQTDGFGDFDCIFARERRVDREQDEPARSPSAFENAARAAVVALLFVQVVWALVA